MGHEVPVVLVPVTLSLLPTPTVGQSWQRDRGGSQRPPMATGLAGSRSLPGGRHLQQQLCWHRCSAAWRPVVLSGAAASPGCANCEEPPGPPPVTPALTRCVQLAATPHRANGEAHGGLEDGAFSPKSTWF